MTLLGRDFGEVDALITDRYLDSLLSAADPRDVHADPTGSGASGRRRRRASELKPDEAVRLASRRLTLDLPRFHPSFRFEERLAVRLAEAAAAMRLPAAAGAEGSVTMLPVAPWPVPLDLEPQDLADRDSVSGLVFTRRPLLIGGAVAASALSLAGAAWVAWRRNRSAGSPMARAARAAHAMRERPV